MAEMCTALRGVVVSVKFQLNLPAGPCKNGIVDDGEILNHNQIVAAAPPAQTQRLIAVCPTDPPLACSLKTRQTRTRERAGWGKQ